MVSREDARPRISQKQGRWGVHHPEWQMGSILMQLRVFWWTAWEVHKFKYSKSKPILFCFDWALLSSSSNFLHVCTRSIQISGQKFNHKVKNDVCDERCQPFWNMPFSSPGNLWYLLLPDNFRACQIFLLYYIVTQSYDIYAEVLLRDTWFGYDGAFHIWLHDFL